MWLYCDVMALSTETITKMEAILRENLREVLLQSYSQSTEIQYHYRFLGQDRMAVFAFIRSLNPKSMAPIFNDRAVTLAKTRFRDARAQVLLGSRINHEAQGVIQAIMNNLSTGTGTAPNKESDIERIRLACKSTAANDFKPTKVDLMVEGENGEIFCFDLKTAKPNIGNFKEFKRTLLEWCAIYLTQNPEAEIHTLIAIPYNPNEPKPYDRWTMRGMLDLPHELKVAAEFWGFLGGEGAYSEVLDCFERVGIALRSEIDEYFAKFAIFNSSASPQTPSLETTLDFSGETE